MFGVRMRSIREQIYSSESIEGEALTLVLRPRMKVLVPIPFLIWTL